MRGPCARPGWARFARTAAAAVADVPCAQLDQVIHHDQQSRRQRPRLSVPARLRQPPAHQGLGPRARGRERPGADGAAGRSRLPAPGPSARSCSRSRPGTSTARSTSPSATRQAEVAVRGGGLARAASPSWKPRTPELRGGAGRTSGAINAQESARPPPSPAKRSRSGAGKICNLSRYRTVLLSQLASRRGIQAWGAVSQCTIVLARAANAAQQ